VLEFGSFLNNDRWTVSSWSWTQDWKWNV